MNINSSESITTLEQFQKLVSEQDIFNIEQSVNFIQSYSLQLNSVGRANIVQRIKGEIADIMKNGSLAQELFDLYRDMEDTVDQIALEHSPDTHSPMAAGSMGYTIAKGIPQNRIHLLRIGNATFVRHLEH